MTTKREYAISLGLAQPGRGRLSREAHAAIEKAMAEGMAFDDAAPIKTSVKTEKSVKVKSEKKREPVSESSGIQEIATRYSNDQLFEGVDSKGKKHVVNARQVCRHCGYSLTSHRCNDPEVLVASMEFVHVTPKG